MTGDRDAALLRRVLPQLIRLGDFIGNGPVDPGRPKSLGERCDLIHDIRGALDGRPAAQAFNDPTVPCCGRDAADCDCPDEKRWNAAAEFVPAGAFGDSTLPAAIRVAGVYVSAGVDEAGRLVISADFDESELGDPTPVVVRMGAEEVWST